jgi:hypothetical protein
LIYSYLLTKKIMAMKKFIVLTMFQAVMIFSLQAQKVSNYTYRLENGINVKTEQCWSRVWVDQRFDTIKVSDQTPPLSVVLRTLGDLTSSSAYKLTSAGKETRLQEAKPGTYNLKLTFKLSGKPGTLSFDIDNILIKPKSKTTVTVTLYDYQILIEETPGNQKGLSYYDSRVNKYKGTSEDNPSCGKPAFYAKGQHDKPVAPGEPINEKTGRIKSGTYDVLITLGAPGRLQKVWLENFTLKPDVSYKIITNVNGGVVAYTGGNKDVKAIHLYPAGVASRQKGNPAPDKNLEILKCEGQTISNTCPPGAYDVLLNFGNGKKYEWRKNVVVKTGSRSEVK